MTETLTIESVIKRFERIAELNNDRFRFSCDIKPCRDGSLRYTFLVRETSDNYEMFSGVGATLKAAVFDAASGIEARCNFIGYRSDLA